MKKIVFIVILFLFVFGLIRIVTSTLENHKRDQAVHGTTLHRMV